MVTVDLISLLFTQILKIAPSTLYKYATVQDQLIYLLLIPHVILFLFLYSFSMGLVGRFTMHHKGFNYLVGIITYIYIVYSGWYGRLAILFVNWLLIALGMALFLFFYSIVISPSSGPAIANLARETGKQLAGKSAKQEEKKAIAEEIEALKKEINALDNEWRSATEIQSKAYLQMRKADLVAQKRRLESRL